MNHLKRKRIFCFDIYELLHLNFDLEVDKLEIILMLRIITCISVAMKYTPIHICYLDDTNLDPSNGQCEVGNAHNRVAYLEVDGAKTINANNICMYLLVLY